MKLKDFYYDLPHELIAQDPIPDRSASRLLKLGRYDGEIGHGIFTDIKDILKKGDCLVINDTKVMPARLMGSRDGTGAAIEMLLLKRIGAKRWETLVKPGKKAGTGDKIIFGNGMLTAVVADIADGGNRIMEFEYEGIWEEVLDRLGSMPLPPYITHELKDKNRYQTVYAKYEGSAAAPTAGLHFTKELLKDIEQSGVDIASVTLHVGLGTFRPVRVEDITCHHMHSEEYVIEEEQAEKINRAKRGGGRIIAVGTTAMRTLESAAFRTSDEQYEVRAASGETDIFIYPGYEFKIADGLITNFHLPESTLLMLVSAFAGREAVMKAYAEAIEQKYRFFSFGDAMLII